MLSRLAVTMVKVLIASLIVGTILDHFGIKTSELIKTAGLSPDRIEELARQGVAWALPNLLLCFTSSARPARARIRAQSLQIESIAL